MSQPTVGIITIATGNRRYYLQAELLAISLKTNMPGLPVALVTDRNDVNRQWFTHIIPVDSSRGGGVQQKVFLDKYTPFSETLFIDSDCIVTHNFERELRELRQFSFSPVCEVFFAPEDSDPYVADMRTALKLVGGNCFPKFNGGIYFFKKDKTAEAIFEQARRISQDYRNYGIKEFNSHGPGEETVFALAMASLHINHLYNDHGKLMRPTMNVSRPFLIQPVNGGCKFMFYQQLVEPAICHFVNVNSMNHHYRKCEWTLRRHNGQLRDAASITGFIWNVIKSVALYKVKLAYSAVRRKVRWSVPFTTSKPGV